MIIIIDKGHLLGRRADLARQIPLEELDIFDVVDNQRVTPTNIQTADLFIVTDYVSNRFRVFKHRYDEEIHGNVFPMYMLEPRVIKPFIDYELNSVQSELSEETT